MIKLIQQHWKTAAVVAVVLVAWWLWDSASRAEVRYETLKASTEKETKRLEEERKELRDQINSLLDNTNRLVARVDSMALENRKLAGEVVRVQSEAARQVESISEMRLDEVATATLTALDLSPPSIRTTADGFALFEPQAVRINLEHLVLGDAAKEELRLSNERIKNFEQQIVTGREIYSNLQEVLKKRDRELDGLQIQHHAELDLQRAELNAIKKIARRRHMMWMAAGAVAGILVARN